MENLIDKRFQCPCCGYPTLDEKASYDICILCNWEDDGQDDSNADEVLGGPNGEYSLTQARNNFKKYLVMYPPSKDKRITGPDTPKQIQVKKELVKLYEIFINKSDLNKQRELSLKINELENALYNILSKKIREYEENIKDSRI